jgi:hypothetical protein
MPGNGSWPGAGPLMRRARSGGRRSWFAIHGQGSSSKGNEDVGGKPSKRHVAKQSLIPHDSWLPHSTVREEHLEGTH